MNDCHCVIGNILEMIGLALQRPRTYHKKYRDRQQVPMQKAKAGVQVILSCHVQIRAKDFNLDSMTILKQKKFYRVGPSVRNITT
jgi:hypothetical protein